MTRNTTSEGASAADAAIRSSAQASSSGSGWTPSFFQDTYSQNLYTRSGVNHIRIITNERVPDTCGLLVTETSHNRYKPVPPEEVKE